MTDKTKKYISAFVLFILTGGIYGGFICLCNRYLRTHDLLNPYIEGIIILVLCIGMYFIYRRFTRLLDKISKKK